MARKISNDQRAKLEAEDGTRVFTKSRAAPTRAEEAIEKQAEVKSEPVDLAPIIDAMAKQNQELVGAIKSMQPPTQQVPPKISSATITNIKRDKKDQILSMDVNVDGGSMIDRIHVDNILRKDDRIKSVDLSVNYKELH